MHDTQSTTRQQDLPHPMMTRPTARRLKSTPAAGRYLSDIQCDRANEQSWLISARGANKATVSELIRHVIDALPSRETGHTGRIAQIHAELTLVPDIMQSDGLAAKSNSDLNPGSPQPFTGGELTFYPSRVELCGVKVCGAKRSGLIRDTLDILKGVDAQGRYRAYSGEELAATTGTEGGPPAVAGAIRNFRNRVKRILLSEVNVDIDPGVDVIVNDRQHGYRLSDKLTVVECPDLRATGREMGEEDAAMDLECPDRTVSDETDEDSRTRWILAELKKNGWIRKRQIIERTGCSDSTARRLLAGLREDGLIVFEGSARNGRWRLCGDESLARNV